MQALLRSVRVLHGLSDALELPGLKDTMNEACLALPGLLDEGGDLHFLRTHPELLSVQVKQGVLLRDVATDADDGRSVTVHIDRENLLASALEGFMPIAAADLRCGDIRVEFRGEQGVGDGVRRECLTLVCEELQQPQYGFFMRWPTAAHHTITVQPISSAYQDDRPVFRFAGRLAALCILQRVPVNMQFPPTIWKQILGLELELADLALVDPAAARQLEKLISPEYTAGAALHAFQLGPSAGRP